MTKQGVESRASDLIWSGSKRSPACIGNLISYKLGGCLIIFPLDSHKMDYRWYDIGMTVVCMIVKKLKL